MCMLHIVYKITNTVNGKIYIGAHSTSDINDNYMGSGKLIKEAILKYGIESFTKTILFTYSTKAEMFAKEKELVSEKFIAEMTNYNLMVGGCGGSTSTSGWEFLQSEEMKLIAKEWNSRGGLIGGPKAKGRKHPPRSTAYKEQVSIRNSNRRYVTHPVYGTKIIKTGELDHYLELGYIRGNGKKSY